MIGKSYDGTLSNGVAATGVEGLKTIVPISAISAWYNYSRRGGIRQNTNYPGSSPEPGHHLQRHAPERPRRINLPNRRTTSARRSTRTSTTTPTLDTGDGDAHGDINTFWRERDYNMDASKVKASVFAIHGLQDDNVKMDHTRHVVGRAEGEQRAHASCGSCAPATRIRSTRVARSGSTRCTAGSTTSSTASRTASTPRSRSRSRTRADVWKNYDSWPINGTQNVDLFLRATGDPAAAGTLGGKTGRRRRHARLHRSHEHQRDRADEHADRLADQPPRVPLAAAEDGRAPVRHRRWPTWRRRSAPTQTNFSVIVADYGVLNADGTRQKFRRCRAATRASNITTQRTCWGDIGNNALTGEAGPACASLGAVVHREPRVRSTTPATSSSAKPLSNAVAVARDARRPRLGEPQLAVVPGRDAGHDRRHVPHPGRDDGRPSTSSRPAIRSAIIVAGTNASDVAAPATTTSPSRSTPARRRSRCRSSVATPPRPPRA